MTAIDITTEPAIDYPSAEELDSGGYAESSGWKATLYLVPAEETETGRPRVEVYGRIGAGVPAHAWHGRWLALGSYGPKVVGQSVLDLLTAAEETLLALADCYRGSHWDGNNLGGSWSEGVLEHHDPLGLESPDAVNHYWDAGEWFAASGADWPWLAREAGIEPDAVLGDCWEPLVERAAAEQEEATGEHHVSGIEAWCREAAEEYREEHGVED